MLLGPLPPVAAEEVLLPSDVQQQPSQQPPVTADPPPPPIPTPDLPPAAIPQAQAPVPIVPPAPGPTPEPAATTGGEVVVQGRSRRGDPLAPVNAQSYAAAQAVDDAVVGPVALAYGKSAPRAIRKGLRNFLGNLREPVVFVNYLLQLKPGKAGETAGRFAINSTIGVAGLIDVAKRRPFRLPRRRNSFANTLGYYGVKPGPFFFVPLIGPTTLRDLIGNGIDQVLVPLGPIRPFSGGEYTIPIGVLSALDYRFEMDEEFKKQRASTDPYAAARRFYLERRQAEIDALRGKPRPAPVAPATVVPER